LANIFTVFPDATFIGGPLRRADEERDAEAVA
jgi:hypothetical protein